MAMTYRRLGKAGTRVSTIARGAWLTYGESVENQGATACLLVHVVRARRSCPRRRLRLAAAQSSTFQPR
jgi:hypothetical protein